MMKRQFYLQKRISTRHNRYVVVPRVCHTPLQLPFPPLVVNSEDLWNGKYDKTDYTN